MKIATLLFFLISLTTVVFADNSEMLKNVSFEQKIGNSFPDDLIFLNESNQEVYFKDLENGKPSLFVFYYSSCKNLCSTVLTNLVSELRHVQLNSERDYNFISLSIDPGESQTALYEKKEKLVRQFNGNDKINSWFFLRGNQKNILKTASALGLHYQYDPRSKEYAHPAGLIFLTPKGKVSSYLLGVNFRPELIKKNLLIAKAERSGSLVENILLYCFHYDPNSSKYGPLIMNSLRMGALLTMMSVFGGVLNLIRTKKV